MTTNQSKSKSGYWYKYCVDECSICGHIQKYKYRVYDEPKPKEIKKRYRFLSNYETYGFCLG